MHRSSDFTAVVRSGRRARSGHLVIHHGVIHHGVISRAGHVEDETAPALVGLIVGKSVGSSVVRHAVSRRLRAQLSARISGLPAGSGTVVRALPSAASADSAELGRDMDAALRRVVPAAAPT
jgi:ribonuclease P protein component